MGPQHPRMLRCFVTMFAFITLSAQDGRDSGRVEVGPNPAAVAFFRNRIEPILRDDCWNCHGPVKHKAGLRLDSLTAMLAGGESGPALIPGDPDRSRLVTSVRRTQEPHMPPDGSLPAQAVADLARWVEIGAPWPTNPAESTPVANVPAAKSGPPLAGRMHPLIVHFPIALTLIVLPFALIARRRGGAWDSALALLIYAGAASAAAAVASGLLFAGHQDPQMLARHELVGWIAASGTLVCALLAALHQRDPSRRWILELALVATALAVGLAGHFGGEMVHGVGFPFR